jgi:hypothetical protein
MKYLALFNKAIPDWTAYENGLPVNFTVMTVSSNAEREKEAIKANARGQAVSFLTRKEVEAWYGRDFKVEGSIVKAKDQG